MSKEGATLLQVVLSVRVETEGRCEECSSLAPSLAGMSPYEEGANSAVAPALVGSSNTKESRLTALVLLSLHVMRGNEVDATREASGCTEVVSTRPSLSRQVISETSFMKADICISLQFAQSLAPRRTSP